MSLFTLAVALHELVKKAPAREPPGPSKALAGPLGTGGGVGPLVSATNIDLRAIGLS
jgi:hypothetical protein